MKQNIVKHNQKGIAPIVIILIIVGVLVLAGGVYLYQTKSSKQTKITISGYVISGGDTTPKGLYDTPRGFVYKVKTDDGAIVDVTYTAYPPSPVGDRERKKIRLSFHGGTILVGDYLKARGSFDKDTNMLTVEDKGDYIETSQKP